MRARCAKCGELLAGHEMLLASLQTMPLPEPSPEFSFRVLDEVSARARPAPRTKWAASIATWAVPLAAAVVVGCVSFWRSWFAPVGQEANDVAMMPAADAHAASDIAKSPGYLALLRETGLTRAGFSPPAWIGQVTDGLKPLPGPMGAVLMAQPLTSPMGAALMALSSTVPGA